MKSKTLKVELSKKKTLKVEVLSNYSKVLGGDK
jgi:hypothetical protein